MFKQLFLFALMIPFLVSCSNDLDVVPNNEITTEVQEMTSFYLKIDSINEKYSTLNEVHTSRGYCSNYAVDAAADAVGGFIGRKLFSWVGASIGAACGNPAIAVGGYLVGGKVGSAAGSAAASIGSAWVRDHFSRSSSHNLVLNENYVVPVNDPNNLSDGELHNLIVARLLKNIDKYVTRDGNLNYELLLEDALAYEKELCPEEEYTDEFKALWLPKTVDQTKRIVNSSSLLISNSSDDFLDDVYNNLRRPITKLPRQEWRNNKTTATSVITLQS